MTPSVGPALTDLDSLMLDIQRRPVGEAVTLVDQNRVERAVAMSIQTFDQLVTEGNVRRQRSELIGKRGRLSRKNRRLRAATKRAEREPREAEIRAQRTREHERNRRRKLMRKQFGREPTGLELDLGYRVSRP